MSAEPEPPVLWSNAQVYGLSIICLAVGLAIGYLIRVPASANSSAGHVPSSDPAASMGQVTVEQLKHMADKKAEPLLAELREKPTDAALLAKIGDTYFTAKQYRAAQEYFERSLAIKKDAVVLNQSSFAAYALGDEDKAIAALNQALEIDPRNRNALFNLGMLQWHVKSDPKAAIAAWEKLLKVHPDDPDRARVEKLIERARLHLNIPPGTMTDKPMR